MVFYYWEGDEDFGYIDSFGGGEWLCENYYGFCLCKWLYCRGWVKLLEWGEL